MTMQELSEGYRQSAELLRQRLRWLRRQEKLTDDPALLFQLSRRKAVLTQMLTEMNELAALTAHYYDRGYTRNAKYTL